jgi:hypothetical protein
MSSTSLEPSPQRTLPVQFWLYRISGYLLINVIDDPAWLALMFC